LQRAAEQEMYGQQALHPSLALQHEFQSLMVAVQSNDIPAAQQALARLQASIHSAV